MTKDQAFFDSVVAFVRKTDTEAELIGVSEFEMSSLETKYGIGLPLSLKNYMAVFGSKFSCWGLSRLVDAFEWRGLELALEVQKSRKTFSGITNWQETQSEFSFLPLEYSEENDFLYFQNGKDDSGYLFWSFDPEAEDQIFHNGLTIVTHFRNLLFRTLLQRIRKNKLEVPDIAWLQFLQKSNFLLGKHLDSFQDEIERREANTNGIISFEKFGERYSQYLIENRILPAMPGVFELS